MVLGFGKKVEPDPYLIRPVMTERFDLVNCNRAEALKVTLPWASNPEILHNLMYDQTQYSRLKWATKLGKPDGRHRFVHAIVARDIKGTIGAHRILLDRSGTVSMAIALTAKSWWGQGVFEEVRAALMDHFSQSPLVERFYGRVITENSSSIYNYKKLGFRMIGYDLRSWRAPSNDELLDTIHFEFLATDWRKKRDLTLL